METKTYKVPMEIIIEISKSFHEFGISAELNGGDDESHYVGGGTNSVRAPAAAPADRRVGRSASDYVRRSVRRGRHLAATVGEDGGNRHPHGGNGAGDVETAGSNRHDWR